MPDSAHVILLDGVHRRRDRRDGRPARDALGRLRPDARRRPAHESRLDGDRLRDPDVDRIRRRARSRRRPLLVATLAVAFVASVVSEALFLILLRRHGAGRTWRVSLVANVASYAVLALAVWVLGRVGF